MTGMMDNEPTARQRHRVLAGATIGNMVSQTPAVDSVFGLFLIPLSEEFGWSRASISGGLGLMALISAIAYPIVGRYADRHGAWRVVLVGNILFAVTMAAMALLNGTLLQYYMLFGLLALFAALPNPALFKKMVIDCYRRDFGFAIGISGGGGIGLGAAIIPVIGAVVMAAYGWRITYVAIGAVILIVGLFAIVGLLRDSRAYGPAAPQGPASEADTAIETAIEMVRAPSTFIGTVPFWLILIACAFMSGVLGAIFGHMVPIGIERGISVGSATIAISGCALANVVWQPVMGWLIDRFASPKIILVPYGGAVAGISLMVMGQGPGTFIVGGVLVGIGVATQFVAMSMLAVRYFGAACYGSVIGLCYAAMFVGSGLSPIVMDALFDAQGTYRLALIGAIALQILGFLLVALLPSFRGDRLPAARLDPLPVVG